MCFWNIGGLKSKNIDKTKDPLFLKEIEKFDIVFLAETHVGAPSLPKGKGNDVHVGGENSKSRIGPFLFYPVSREITKCNNRYFGGLGILCKESIKKTCKTNAKLKS